MGIYVNQVGYPVTGQKIAVSTTPCSFQVIRTDNQRCAYDGVTTEAGYDSSSGDITYHIDFSALKEPGQYYILSGKGEKSPTFSIASKVYKTLKKDMMKAFYFQRCGVALTEEYAGEYVHKACHTAPAIFLEDYQNKTENPKTFDMTGGWHDAGDFGRYSTAAAVALGHLLYAYELFPESLQDDLTIPESGNGIPDILNECLYELRWLLKMQAPDGGVYHKLTAFSHAPFVMPEDDHDQFLIYPVSSIAVADFVAVMCLASRVYAPFDADFSAKALSAACKSWEWLLANPYVGFHNPEGSNTGEYGDESDTDERLWAAAEMFRSSEQYADSALTMLKEYAFSNVGKIDFGWVDVSGLATLSILSDTDTKADDALISVFKSALFAGADHLLTIAENSGYLLGMEPDDFVWGSNMVVCNRSMLLILASLFSSEDKTNVYKEAALSHLHYLLGRNALGISYVTGHGENAFKNPHNRPTAMDGIDFPMPGWVSGGPFKHFCDEAALNLLEKGTPAMKCYVDDVGSYSTNEITIYWNSPAVFMCAYFEAYDE